MSLISATHGSSAAADAAIAQSGAVNAKGQRVPDFVVHNSGDTVGVVSVETVKAGDELVGWIMETDETITLTAKAAIPLGHKVAIRPIRSGDTILKYDHDIGRAVEDIPEGGYVHYQNVKTKRW